jgi:ABC-2 type transport system permease protein
MIARLIRLQLKLEWRDTRASTAATVLTLIFGLGFIYAALQAAMWMTDLRGASESTRVALTVAGFGVFTLAWPAGVVFVMGSNELLDPGRFALYPVSAKRLLPGLLVAGFFGLGGVCTVIAGYGFVVAWSQSVASAVAALVGVALGLTFCVVASRALTSVLSELFRRRKARDITMVAMLLVILAGSFGLQMLPTLADGDLDLDRMLGWVNSIASVIALTPFGWPWALPAHVAAGEWGIAAALSAGMLVLIAALLLVWQHQIALGLVRPLESGGSGEKIKGSALIDRLFPANPAGAVAKRSMRYWRRDPRRLMGIVAVLIVPLAACIPIVMMQRQGERQPGDPSVLTVLTYLPALLGWMTATMSVTDISYDGSALGQQIVAGVSGRNDRLGRAWSTLVIVVPMQLSYILAVFVYSGQWAQLPNVLGVCVAMVLGGVGVGSWAGAMWQMPQRPAGQSNFARGSSATAGGFVGSMVGMFVPLVVAIPTVVCIVVSIFYGWMSWVALLVGLLSGWGVMWWGIVAGGKKLDASWPEVLEKVTWKG